MEWDEEDEEKTWGKAMVNDRSLRPDCYAHDKSRFATPAQLS
jgi:hypothetical protein